MLRADCGGSAVLEMELSETATLGALFGQLAETYPRLERRVRDEQGEVRRFVNVYVNGDESRRLGGMSASLGEGAVVQIIPSVAGG
jgi:sulfur-carrier protein